MKTRPAYGFTLLELIVTMAVAAVLVTIAVPSYRALGQRSAIDAASNDLASTLHYARSQAVKQGQRICVCASDDQQSCSGSWSDGWIVFAPTPAAANCTLPDANAILRVHKPVSNRANIAFNNGDDTFFDANGFATMANIGRFTITTNDTPDQACLFLARTGRLRTDHGAGC